jgi:hypothetical protein
MKSKHCPKHTANLPSNEVSTATGPVAGSSEEVSELPPAHARVAGEIVESDLVEKEKEVNFGTVAANSDRESEAVFTATSTSVSERLDTEFSVSGSAHDANVGIGTEVTLEFENDTDQNILSSQSDMILYANFADQLDFDVESTDSNLLDLDDLDIFLEESNL